MSPLQGPDLHISLVLAAGLCCKRLVGAQRQALLWQQEPATEEVLHRVSFAALTSISGSALSLFSCCISFSFFFFLLWESDVQVADPAAI